jgi:hypothetical protein
MQLRGIRQPSHIVEMVTGLRQQCWIFHLLARPKQHGPAIEHARHMEMNEKTRKSDPDWAIGLKQLYDSVVDEPLPDAFKDLLSRLDEKDTK